MNRLIHQQVMPVGRDHFFLGVLIFMEYHKRILPGEFGTIPKPIRDDAFAQGGYCLDAPSEFPAGGCEYHFVDLDPAEGGLSVQLVVERETP